MLLGGAGNDTLEVATGDQAFGGGNDDRLIVTGSAPSRLDGGTGADALVLNVNDDITGATVAETRAARGRRARPHGAAYR